MIKHINHQNVSTTPFVAAKAHVLSNIQNSDTVILEPNAYPYGTNVSLDYVDYNSGNPIINRECDIALEQQDIDLIGYEEGITGSATFNSSSDARNTDGTYKSLVHRQTKNAFYNTYRNPTEIFGVEHIDFPLSKTLRNLSDSFRMFTVPQMVFGDKIQPQSLRFYDTLLDDSVEIFDDGYQNLIAGYNLFSKVQEVRTFPSGAGAQNEILPGTSSFICPTYGQYKVITISGNDSAFFDSTLRFGSATVNTPNVDLVPSLGAAFLTGSVNLFILTLYTNETGSIDGGFDSGYIFNTVVTIPEQNETGSFDSGFDSGYIFNLIVVLPEKNETGSIDSGFDSGYTTTIVSTASISDSPAMIGIGFQAGSVV